MGGGIGGFVEVEDAVTDVVLERAFEGGMAGGERRVVASSDVEAVVVLEQDGPLGGVQGRGEGLGFDKVVFLHRVLCLSGDESRGFGFFCFCFSSIDDGVLVLLLLLLLGVV